MSVEPQVQDLLKDPSQFKVSFPKQLHSVIGTRVLTYVFYQKDESKVDVFVKYIKDTFPNALLSIVKDQDGFISVTITQLAASDQPATDTASADDSNCLCCC